MIDFVSIPIFVKVWNMGPHTKKSLAALTVLSALGIASQASAQSVSTVTGPKQMGAVDTSACVVTPTSTGEAICAAFQSVQGRNGSQTVARTSRNDNANEYMRCQSICTGPGLFHYGGTVQYSFPAAGIYSYCFNVPENRITLDTFSSGDTVCAVNRITIGRENPNNLSPGYRAGGDSMNPNGICPEPAEFTPLANYCPAGTTLNRIEGLGWCVKN